MKFKLIKQDGAISINGVKISPTANELVQSITKTNINDCRAIRTKNRGIYKLC